MSAQHAPAKWKAKAKRAHNEAKRRMGAVILAHRESGSGLPLDVWERYRVIDRMPFKSCW